jgi:hypothetical protein
MLIYIAAWTVLLKGGPNSDGWALPTTAVLAFLAGMVGASRRGLLGAACIAIAGAAIGGLGNSNAHHEYSDLGRLVGGLIIAALSLGLFWAGVRGALRVGLPRNRKDVA